MTFLPPFFGRENVSLQIDNHVVITYDQFEHVEMRVGTIIRAEEFPEARKPAYKLWIDFGADAGVKQSSAQITALYNVHDLIGVQVVAVVNFPPRQIATFRSEVLTLGTNDEQGNVVLLKPVSSVPNGSRVY